MKTLSTQFKQKVLTRQEIVDLKDNVALINGIVSLAKLAVAEKRIGLIFDCKNYAHFVTFTALYRVLLLISRIHNLQELVDVLFLVMLYLLFRLSLLTFLANIFCACLHIQLEMERRLLLLYYLQEKIVITAVINAVV